MQKVRKILRAVSEKIAWPTNQLLPTTQILQDLADAGPKKKHHYTIKICCLKIWKKRCTLNRNLNLYYICKSKVMNFFANLIQEAVLARSACSSHSLLFWRSLFNYFWFSLVFGIDSFFEGITNIMTRQYFLFDSFYIHSMNSIIFAQKTYI